MKKILSILVCVFLSITGCFAYNTITVRAYAVNKDATFPVGGTVTLKVSKSSGENGSDKDNTTKTSDLNNNNVISVKAQGSDGWKIPFIGIVTGSYNPKVDLSVSANTDEGFYVEGIYLEKDGGVLEPAGVTGVSIEGVANATYTYKVVFAKRNSTVPEEITLENLNSISFFTGTEDDQLFSDFYKEKTQIDLSRVFGNEVPLYDWLYIFGITTSTDGTLINNPSIQGSCNASTPCYVYKKIDNKYVFDSEVDASLTRYDHNTSKNTCKLYFTGYCPFANIGTQPNDEGWMYFKGSNTTIDIYLDNCVILGRYRTGDGAAYGFATKYVDLSTGDNYMNGFSSIFVFEGTSNQPYRPTIHINGTNHLKGQLGYITEVLAMGSPLDELLGGGIVAAIENINTASSPITIKGSDGLVELTLDDVFPLGNGNYKITNGYLRLDSYPLEGDAERVPSIDLGSENGSLTINGGQYHLRNAASLDGAYTCNMVFGYRKYSAYSLVSLYGFGGDFTDCKVVINSGTFTMYKNMYGFAGSQYYLDQIEFLDFRLPYGNGKSAINGGTFNGINNVVMCSSVSSTGRSPINSQEESLCLQEIPAVDVSLDDDIAATFSLPNSVEEHGYSDGVVYDLSMSGAMDKLKNATAYGGQSVNAFDREGEKYVSVLLPTEPLGCTPFEESICRSWVTAIPAITAAEGLVNMGGDVEVETLSTEGETSMPVIVNQLMYVDMQGMESYDLGGQIDFANDKKPRGNITNDADYELKKHLNMLKVVDADRWYCFTAPFDIVSVSVLELQQSEIDELAKTSRQDAINKQLLLNAQMWVKLEPFIIPNKDTKRSSGLNFEELLTMVPGAVLQPLEHYNGSNMMTANYYLYELESEQFTTDGTGKNLKIKWVPVGMRNPGEIILKKGHTYAMQFPWCPMCEQVDEYDYWSKKFIRFYGVGPQWIDGANKQSSLSTPPDQDNTAILRGNSTLKDYILSRGYVHETDPASEDLDYFVFKTDQVIKPTQGFLLYNSGGAKMPARISRAGQIEYSENDATSVDGVPTVGDRTTLMLFGAMDGFEVLSLGEQLVTVYNLQGNIIFQQYMTAGEQVYVATGAGIYVVRGESEAIKVMVD